MGVESLPHHRQLRTHFSVVFILKMERAGKSSEGSACCLGGGGGGCSASAFVLKQAHATASISLLLVTNERQV